MDAAQQEQAEPGQKMDLQVQRQQQLNLQEMKERQQVGMGNLEQ